MRSSFLSSLQQIPPARLALAHLEIRGVSTPLSAFSMGQTGIFDWFGDVPSFVGSGTEGGWPVVMSEGIVGRMERVKCQLYGDISGPAQPMAMRCFSTNDNALITFVSQ